MLPSQIAVDEVVASISAAVPNRSVNDSWRSAAKMMPLPASHLKKSAARQSVSVRQALECGNVFEQGSQLY
jgi:hypothetical protein